MIKINQIIIEKLFILKKNKRFRNKIKLILFFCLITLSFINYQVKAESELSLDIGLSINFVCFSPFISLNYRPIEKSINTSYKKDFGFEVRLFSNTYSYNDTDYFIGFGLKKYIDISIRNEDFFVSGLLFARLNNLNKNNFFGTNLSLGSNSKSSSDFIKSSKKASIGFGFGEKESFFYILPEIGGIVDL